jgi:hypothetical protein
MRIEKVICRTIAVLLLNVAVTFAADKLERGFQNPPESAKPQTWWHWMNNNVTREGITADLEAMKRAGLGGAHIFNISWGIPDGFPITSLSPEWYAMVNHAVKEADRVGIELGLHNCPGWVSSGGPWITPELAQQRVVTSEQMVQGPTRFSAVLPQPPIYGHYRDVAVLAFPTPRCESAQMADRAPKVTSNSPEFDGAALMDCNPKTAAALKLPPEPQKPYVQFEFAEPCPVRSFRMAGSFTKPVELQASDDGQNFKPIGKHQGYYGFTALYQGTYVATEAVKARFFRVEFQREQPLAISEIDLSERLRVEKFLAKTVLLHGAGKVIADNVATFAGQTAPGDVVPLKATIDLTAKMAPDGRLDWEVPTGQWTILRVGHTCERSENKPAPKGARGLECDKLSKVAVEAHWAGMMKKIVEAAGPLAGKALTGVTIDSWEIGVPNWTRAMLEEFRCRRGYDLLPFLPVFSDRIVESPEITERFLWDFRRTVAELFTENYYGHMSTLARRNGLELASERGPLDDLADGGACDIPMGEFWNDGAPWASCKHAASAAHTYGRKIVGAEAFTSSSKWTDHPYRLKSVGDMIYTKGVNRFYFHRYAMQPWTDQFPGMTMGNWGSHIERTATWWEPGRAWFGYLSRCQFLLQEGRFVADLCLLDNEDYLACHVGMESLGGTGPMIIAGLPAGYDFDLCGRDRLLAGMQFKDGFFELITRPAKWWRGGTAMRYRFLALPDSLALTLPVVKKVRELVAAGGTVIGPKPRFSPTLENYPACEAEIRQIADEVWGPCDGKTVTEHRYGKGRIIWGQSYTNIFAAAKLPPDFDVKQKSGSAQINAIHRQTKKADWYFVAKRDTGVLETVCSFRVTGQRPEFWYPDTGKIEPAANYWVENGQTHVPIHFDPVGSVFVVFRERSQNSEVRSQKGCAKAPELKSIMELSGPWEVSFDPKWFYAGGETTDDRPQTADQCKVVFEKLEDWSKRPAEAVKYFSGTAIYRKEFDCPLPTAHCPLYLDLGAVEVIAEVELNGRNLGVLWKPPFRVDVTAELKVGTNTLVVKVTNLWPNRLIGDEQLPEDCEWQRTDLGGMQLKQMPEWLMKSLPRTSGRRTFATWKHWKAEDPLQPSGLIGPVRILISE